MDVRASVQDKVFLSFLHLSSEAHCLLQPLKEYSKVCHVDGPLGFTHGVEHGIYFRSLQQWGNGDVEKLDLVSVC